MYRNFSQWLYETKTPLPMASANRDLIFGAFGAMKRIIPQIGEFGDSDSGKLGDTKYQYQTETSPWVLVVWDNTNKRMAFGSHNCNVCKKYDTKAKTCTPFDTPKPVTQASIRRYDTGGCVAIDLVDPLSSGEKMDYGSKKYDGVMAAVGKGAIFRLANGKLSMVYRPGEITVDEDEEEYQQLSPYEKEERERYGQ